jgi:hypothetical protein
MVKCSEAATAISLTDAELSKTCDEGILNNMGSVLRDGMNMITDASLTTILAALKTAKIVPTAPTSVDISTTDEYISKLNVFVTSSKAEYTYYEIRYNYALTKFLSAVRDNYNNPTTSNAAIIPGYLSLTQTLNRKLNDLIQIIRKVSDSFLETSSGMSEQLTRFNQTIQENRTRLTKQNQIISSSEAVTKIKKEMVKYSEEKARYTDNLLKLYSFLNVVALGLLVYVYRASE